MNICAQIRSTLLTDYIDNELDERSRNSVEEHLASCIECRAMVEKVKIAVSLIADDGLKQKVPPNIWPSIVTSIESGPQPKSAVMDFIRALGERLTPARLVPALAGIVLLVLSASFFLYTDYIRNQAVVSEYGYNADILGVAESSAESESAGLRTPIEEYFL